MTWTAFAILAMFQSLNACIFFNDRNKILVKTHNLNQTFFDKDTVIVYDKVMPNFLFDFVVSCIIITRINYVLSYKATELIES